GATTNDAAVVIPAANLRDIAVLFAERSGLNLATIRERFLWVRQLEEVVVAEVTLGEPWTLLEHHHGEAVARELARHDATCGAYPDDDEIHFVAPALPPHLWVPSTVH